MPRRSTLLLPLMAAALLAYGAAHSPALHLIGRLAGLPAGRCYFTCGGWIAGRDPAVMAAAWLLLGAALLAAAIVAGRLRLRRFEWPLALGLGLLGLTAVPAAALGAIGWAAGLPLLRPPVGPLLVAIPALVVLAAAARRGWRPPVLPRGPMVAGGLQRLFLLLAATLLAASAAITLGHPPTGYDALSYHGPLAVYFWRDGDIGALLDRAPWAWAQAHPGTAELWFGLLRLAGGEHVASLGQLPFALLGAAAVYAFARRTGLGRGASRLGALAFLLAPIVVLQSGSQVNDLAAGALLMTAAALAAAPTAEWTGHRFAAVGLGLGLAVTTKLAALPAAGAIVLYLAVTGRHRLPATARRLALAFAAGAVVVAPWWLRNLALFGNPIYPAALPILGRGYVVGDFVKKDGWFVPARWAWPLYPLIEPHNDMSGFGALFAVGALAGIAALVTRRRGGPLRLYLVLLLVALPAWWLLTQHEPRLILGLFGLGFGFLGWALAAVPRAHRARAALVLGAAAAFSALVTVDQGLRPLAAAPNGRAEFYEQVWNVDSVAAGLPPEEGLLYHTGHARLSYAGDYPLLGPALRRTLLVVDGDMPTDSIVGLMRRAGLRYAYLPAAPDAGAAAAAMYPPARFELVHQSAGAAPHAREVMRYLFRLRTP